MAVEKAVKRAGLPAGKTTMTEPEMRAAIEHCRKMVRDGFTSGIWSLLNLSVAMYNLNEFLWQGMGYDSFVAAAELEFGLQKRHSYRYREIGEAVALTLGGGYVTQERLKSHVKAHLYETRLGYRKIQLLAKSADGMQRLLDSKSEEDVVELIEELNRGAAEIEAAQDEKGKTPLKKAMGRNYDKGMADITDVSILFDTALRQLKEFSDKYASKLASAVRSLPIDVMAQKKVPARKAQEMWNRLRQLHEVLAPIAQVWPDAVPQVQELHERLAEFDASQSVAVRGKRTRRGPVPEDLPESDNGFVSPAANQDMTWDEFHKQITGVPTSRG